ncbi:uncharacterized protein LOC116273836 [Papio anubis]|uniref:uncharacterized protein LOC103887555 n=1 Tax=Papio anubis TaxID=9555 RepID=UPI0004F1FE7D|nr:uncharacterized protein LOC103887555 [Papio anubis]XP_031519620.1 uncharacterized protein LOC116273836 [Papio anubis]
MRLPALAANWLLGVGKRVPPPGAHKGASTTCTAAAAASRPASDPRARPGLRERGGWTSGKAWRAASGKPSGVPAAPSTGEPQTTVNEERRAGETSASAQKQRPATRPTGDRWTPWWPLCQTPHLPENQRGFPFPSCLVPSARAGRGLSSPSHGRSGQSTCWRRGSGERGVLERRLEAAGGGEAPGGEGQVCGEGLGSASPVRPCSCTPAPFGLGKDSTVYAEVVVG